MTFDDFPIKVSGSKGGEPVGRTEIGKLIARLRKEAGYTQASLAEMLFVTDKAVSKWERGLGCPDSSILPRLAMCLDTDIEILISGLSDYQDLPWEGFLLLEEGETGAATPVYDKPLIYYLLSYFLLVGITDITIKTSLPEYIKGLHLEQFGLSVSFSRPSSDKVMAVNGKTLLFGGNLTRKFQNMMGMEEDTVPSVDGLELPFLFAHQNKPLQELIPAAKRSPLGRGMINLPLNTSEQIRDASEFVRIYQENHGLKIADLKEIAWRRGLLKQ